MMAEKLLGEAMHGFGMAKGMNDMAFSRLFGDLEFPYELEQNLERYREHLALLVRSLRSAGIGESQIEESVTEMVASYKDELMRTMKKMVR